MKKITTKPLFTVLPLVALISACGGGEISNTIDSTASSNQETTNQNIENTPTPQPNTITGSVADGYIKGAKVCLDLNDNLACDDNEPSATTGEKGTFSIETDDSNYSIIAEVPATAIDEDDNQTVNKPFSLSAPAGELEFVSPLTTMIHETMQSNSALTKEEAEEEIKSQLGLDRNTSLFEDYVDKKTSDDSYDDIHKTAQALTSVMQDMEKNAEDTVANNGHDIDTANSKGASRRISREALKEKLSEIRDAMANAPKDDSFDPDTVTQSIRDSIDLSDKTLDEINQLISSPKREKPTLSDALNVFLADIYTASYTCNESSCEYTTEQFSLGEETNGAYTLNSAYKNSSSENFITIPSTDLNPYKVFLLQDNQWVETTKHQLDYYNSVEFIDDKAIMRSLSGHPLKITLREKDLSDKPVSVELLKKIGIAPKNQAKDLIFGKDATLFEAKYAYDSSLIYIASGPDSTDCADTNSICKEIRLASDNSPLTDISSITSATSQAVELVLEKLDDNGKVRIAEFTANDNGLEGQVVLYIATEANGSFSDKKPLTQGKWELETHGETQIIKMISAKKGNNQKMKAFESEVLAVVEGYVRIGHYFEENYGASVDFYNSLAYEKIEEAMIYSHSNQAQ